MIRLCSSHGPFPMFTRQAMMIKIGDDNFVATLCVDELTRHSKHKKLTICFVKPVKLKFTCLTVSWICSCDGWVDIFSIFFKHFVLQFLSFSNNRRVYD